MESVEKSTTKKWSKAKIYRKTGETDGYDDVSKGIVYIYNSKQGIFEKIKFGKKENKTTADW
jgi:hypothetical protein